MAAKSSGARWSSVGQGQQAIHQSGRVVSVAVLTCTWAPALHVNGITMQPAAHRRSSTYNAPPPKQLRAHINDLFSDSRKHGCYQGPIRSVSLARAASPGGGTIAKSEDGVRCVVAGRACQLLALRSRACCLLLMYYSAFYPTSIRARRVSDFGSQVGRRPWRSSYRGITKSVGRKWA